MRIWGNQIWPHNKGGGPCSISPPPFDVCSWWSCWIQIGVGHNNKIRVWNILCGSINNEEYLAARTRKLLQSVYFSCLREHCMTPLSNLVVVSHRPPPPSAIHILDYMCSEPHINAKCVFMLSLCSLLAYATMHPRVAMHIFMRVLEAREYSSSSTRGTSAIATNGAPGYL